MNLKYLYLFLFLSLFACTKDMDQSKLANNMLSGKTWFLDYTLQNNETKSFIGRSTYYIQFKEDGSTIDADGIIGTYEVVKNNTQLALLVVGKTQNGVATNYTYQIDKIGYTTVIFSYTQNSIFIQKIFSTTH
jgi:hypothetical protein